MYQISLKLKKASQLFTEGGNFMYEAIFVPLIEGLIMLAVIAGIVKAILR